MSTGHQLKWLHVYSAERLGISCRSVGFDEGIAGTEAAGRTDAQHLFTLHIYSHCTNNACTGIVATSTSAASRDLTQHEDNMTPGARRHRPSEVYDAGVKMACVHDLS